MTVQPVVIKYKWKNFCPNWEGIPFIEYSCMMNMLLCDGFMIEVHRLPPFKPNDYLFEKYKDKGKEKWEIYAWAVRQAMAKFGNFKLTD